MSPIGDVVYNISVSTLTTYCAKRSCGRSRFSISQDFSILFLYSRSTCSGFTTVSKAFVERKMAWHIQTQNRTVLASCETSPLTSRQTSQDAARMIHGRRQATVVLFSQRADDNRPCLRAASTFSADLCCAICTQYIDAKMAILTNNQPAAALRTWSGNSCTPFCRYTARCD